ncbi:MAG: hypothetical protein IKY95_08210 [Bacteroidales bacterium]|nr:hypothetical protein [Bacteroidales bacterium]
MSIFRNWSWKAAAGAVKEFIIALGRGDLVLRMRVDRAFPYILWLFFLGCMSIWWSYMAEQTMLRVEKNNDILKELRIQNTQMTYELVQMDRMGKVEDILNEMGSKVQPPQKPADKLKK